MQEQAAVPERLSLSPGWLAFAALALAIPAGALLLTPPPEPAPEVIADLPAFALVDEGGKPFGKAEMKGRVWIADFIFTSCADACPKLTQKMKGLQDRLVAPEQGGQIALLSISVDPARDTPAKLLQYGEAYGARRGLWKWLTGPQGELERTVVEGFKIALDRQPREAAAGARLTDDQIHAEAFDIFHGEKLVLVDKDGRIRGYYDAEDARKLLRDARALTSGGRG